MSLLKYFSVHFIEDYKISNEIVKNLSARNRSSINPLFQAAKEREPHLDIRQHDLEDPFPFEKGTFSMVMCNQVIEHLPKETAHNALRESYRVLGSGGNLFVYSPSIFNREQAQEPAAVSFLPALVEGIRLVGLDQRSKARAKVVASKIR